MKRSLTQVGGWIEERLALSPLISAFLDRKIPAGVGWLNTLGSATMVTFIILAVTGIFLSMNYSPSPDHAWDSIQYITEELPFGSLIRGIHYWAANAMVVLVFLHMLRVYFMAAYKYPRELTWVLGVFLLLLVLGAAFTGYLLPWDQKAYWATTVGTKIAGTVPVMGEFQRRLLLGGTDMGAATLTRFYALHMLVIPVGIALLIGGHLFLVIRQGISTPPDRQIKDRNDAR
ncbi:MAG: cytochrome b N-terminal domain-containing protein [Dehalococcoidia bacterium]|nr:cytochrome b N-terminal domain-containing protein [Dehalococcoidia bacterium]